MEIVIIT